jgi:basic membrane protein A and related proteins
VAMVLPGRIDDLAWNTAAYNGLQAIKKDLGVEVTHVENVDPADVEHVLRDFAGQGYDLIVAHSYDYGDAVVRVAKDFPNTYFLHGTAEGHGPNYANYDIPSHEGGYLVGMLAGGLTKSNVIGIVNSFDIPSMVMVSEAFKLGVKQTNPNAKVIETFVGAWNDAAKGGEAANAQVDAKADFIMAMGDHTGLGAIQAAQKRGVLAAGLYSDQNAAAPETVVTSIDNRFDVIMKKGIADIAAGTFADKSSLPTMPDGAVALTPYHGFESKIPQELKDKVAAAAAKIKSGELKVPVITTPTK